jgi:hypothetical protein
MCAYSSATLLPRRLPSRRRRGMKFKEGSVTTVLDRIDASLRAAIVERDRCTRRWAYSPTTANANAAQRAQDELDAVLDRRFAAQ